MSGVVDPYCTLSKSITADLVLHHFPRDGGRGRKESGGNSTQTDNSDEGTKTVRGEEGKRERASEQGLIQRKLQSLRRAINL